MCLERGVDVEHIAFWQEVDARGVACAVADQRRWHDEFDALWVQAQGHGRADAGRQQALGLVVKLHGKSARSLQQSGGTVHGLQCIARVDGIDQVRNQFAVAVVAEVVTPVLQLAAQGCVVVDVAPMQDGHARACPGLGIGALTELGLRRIQKPKGRQLAVKNHL